MIKNMTALVSCFARCYHTKNSTVKIYNDPFSDKILSSSEYEEISKNMFDGINFFNPDYNGNNPLDWIVNNRLAPSVLARSAFCERHLLNELSLGLKQYIILAAGYDTSAYSVNRKLKVFEMDVPEMTSDKINRIDKAGIGRKNVIYTGCDFNGDWIENLILSGYNPLEKSFFSLLGISYYLKKDVFENTIRIVSENMYDGSCIIFDYPNNNETEGEITNQRLAKAAGEEMKSNYSYKDIENTAESCGLLIYEHLIAEDINSSFFKEYNKINPDNKIKAPKGVSYCFMVKK